MAFYPEQIKSIDNKKPTDSPDIRFSLKDPVDPMFSKLQCVLDEYKGEKISAAGLIPYLSSRGVKAEEIKWSGIEQFIEGKKSVAKAELAEFLAGNSLRVEDIELAENTKQERERLRAAKDRQVALANDAASIFKELGFSIDANEILYELKPSEYVSDVAYDLIYDKTVDDNMYAQLMNISQELAKCEATINVINRYAQMRKVDDEGPQYKQYKLQGGENYRELLFTLPTADARFDSSHWDERNVLAHTRLQDFTAADGGKVLFVEEVQSDWHQKGREGGYRDSTKELPDGYQIIETDGSYIVRVPSQYHESGYQDK